MAKPSADKSWTNFKTHFDEAYQYLLNVQGETIQNTSFQNQANLLSQQIVDLNHKHEADKAEIFQMVDDAKSSILTAMSTVPSLQSSEEDMDSNITPHTAPSANATQYDKIQLKILQILEQIDNKLDDKRDPKRPRNRRILDHYCWTHGAGNHKSADCRNKRKGHKDNATFDNHMNGSNAFCKAAAAKPK